MTAFDRIWAVVVALLVGAGLALGYAFGLLSSTSLAGGIPFAAAAAASVLAAAVMATVIRVRAGAAPKAALGSLVSGWRAPIEWVVCALCAIVVVLFLRFLGVVVTSAIAAGVGAMGATLGELYLGFA